MQITQVTFRRKVNTGSFESFDVEATAAITEHEDPITEGRKLQQYVGQMVNERVERLRQPGKRGGVDAGEVPLPWES